MAIEKETTRSMRLTRDDLKLVRTLEKKFEPTHGRLKFSQIVRMALRKLAEEQEQQVA